MKKFLTKIIDFFKSLFGSSKPENAKIEWTYGGLNASSAKEDPNVQIANFAMNFKSMTFTWTKGMSAWGYEHSDPKGIACVFLWDDGKKCWVGGKFEYISTSRTSREWTNIKNKYGGWDYSKFMAAKKHAFCVVSGDFKKRTNLITD